MTKKVCKEKFFSVITKNQNWEILTKNLVTFKDTMGLKMKWKTLIFWAFTEKSLFQLHSETRTTLFELCITFFFFQKI